MKRYLTLIILTVMTWAITSAHVVTGAERLGNYLPMLEGKRVALYTNHSGLVNGRLTVDLLLENGVNVVVLYSPEHGIRGTADNGETVGSGVDEATGLPVISLFGPKYRAALDRSLDDVDVIVTDIQDVGLRFYTYHITMLELMDRAAARGKQFVVLDRPNPLGMTVDGPILDMKYASGVGKLPIPVVHGLTLGELAGMINGEGWLKNGARVDLTVVPCEGYTHSTRYILPVPPSPNLPDMHSVYLYPSTCLFEGTAISLGRGTDWPFQVYGHPSMTTKSFTFIPRSRQGAKNPPLLGRKCHGVDLRGLDDEAVIAAGINLDYIIDAYKSSKLGARFFNSFFENLIGRGDIRSMITSGKSSDEIKATWAGDVERFKVSRKPYLLYPEE